MNIYVASSWRNKLQPRVVEILRSVGHDVYDFRNPAPGNTGFGWRQIDPRPPSEWSTEDYRQILASPRAQEGFALDMHALRTCDACVLLPPCGRSAHLELGWAAGAGKRTLVLCERVDEPELMYLMCSHIAVSIDEAVEWLAGYQRVMAAPVIMDLFEIDEGGESHICAARDHAEALELTGIGIDADDEVTVKRLSKSCELSGMVITDEDGGKSTYAQEVLGAEKDGHGRLISSTAW